MYAIHVAYTHHLNTNATLEANICKHMLNYDFCIRQRSVKGVEVEVNLIPIPGI